MLQDGGGKLPGKTQYSGRRRITTRKSGFKSHPDSTGGEFKVEEVPALSLNAGEIIQVTYTVPNKLSGISAFGGWFTYEGDIEIQFEGLGAARLTLGGAVYPNWGKFGSMWQSEDDRDQVITVTLLGRQYKVQTLKLLGLGFTQ